MKKYLVNFFVSVTMLTGFSANAQEIKARADAWCPYNCQPDQKNPGYLIEILNKTFGKVDYKLLGWEQTLDDVKNGTYDVAVGASANEAPDLIYPKEKLGEVNSSIITKKGSKISVTDVNSLKQYKLGYVKDYYYSEKLNKYIETPGANVFAVTGDNVTEDLVMALIEEKVDAIVEDANVADYVIESKGYSGIFDYFSLGEKSPVSLGFSPKNPKSKEYAEKIDQTVLEMKKTGEYDKLLKKYSIK